MSGSMSGMWKRSHGRTIKHGQKKKVETDMSDSHPATFRLYQAVHPAAGD